MVGDSGVDIVSFMYLLLKTFGVNQLIIYSFEQLHRVTVFFIVIILKRINCDMVKMVMIHHKKYL